ncbi:MAG: ribbon-helix-helix protein, CopG family [Actinomycetota bacterium]|nr:ribbon-helix-helix protein, CopG family [Actinomycetota bacterium]
MTLISVRLPEPELQALDSMAMEAQLSRSGLLRRALGEVLAGKLPPRPAPPGEAELLAVLGERARAGSVVAIKELLRHLERERRACERRGAQTDPFSELDPPGPLRRLS